MYHFSTQNLTFLKMAKIYQEMGVENNAFVLRIDNPALLYVNAHDKNLTDYQKLAVGEECVRNIWYYHREVVRIATAGGNIPFQAHRGNIAITWAHSLNLNTLIMLPRQTNKTTTVLANYSWDFYFNAENTEFALYGLSERFLKDNMDKFKNIRDSCPDYLQFKNKNDRENVSEIRYNIDSGKYNLISYVVSASSEDKAKLVSRGSSKARMMRDEFAFTPFIKIEFANSIYAFLEVARKAKINGSSYGITMLTTAGFLNQECGRWAFNKFNDAVGFDEIMYDMTYETKDGDIRFDRAKIIDYIIKNHRERDGVPNTEFSVFLKINFQWYEMGYDQEWLKSARAASDTEDDFRREVLGEWQDSTLNHPYGQDRIRELQLNKRRPYETIIISKVYTLKIYREMTEKDWNLPLICGMDSGSNIGNDFSTLVFTDPTNFEVVAVMRTNQYSAIKFGQAVSYLLEKVFPNAILVPERNGLGSIIIQYIMESMTYGSGSRIYKDKVVDFTDNSAPYGVHLTQQIRDLFFNDILRNALINEIDKIHDEDIVLEITGLRFTNTGRVDHQKDGHDDTLMAYLYTRWFLSYAPNRNKYIDPIIIGSQNFKKETNIKAANEVLEGVIKNENTNYGKILKSFGVENMDEEYKLQQPWEIQKQYLEDLENEDILDKFTEDEYKNIYDRGYDIRDIMIDRIHNDVNKSREHELEAEEVDEYRTKDDIEKNYSRKDFELEPEKLKEDIEKKKREEITKEEMRSQMSYFFDM